MPLKFHPSYGTVLICDFSTGFHPPEMVKKRPVIVVSPRKRHNAETLTVVPLSTRKPTTHHPWHHAVDMSSMPKGYLIQPTWAKCDMLTTVAFWRLDRIRVKQDGKRVYFAPMLGLQDLQAVKKGIAAHLGLTLHMD